MARRHPPHRRGRAAAQSRSQYQPQSCMTPSIVRSRMPVSRAWTVELGPAPARLRGHVPPKPKGPSMRYLHTMLRVRDLDAALKFFCDQLGLVERRRRPDEKGRYTNVFLAAPQDRALVETSLAAGRDAPLLEITYNWDAEDYGEARYFGHLAF